MSRVVLLPLLYTKLSLYIGILSLQYNKHNAVGVNLTLANTLEFDLGLFVRGTVKHYGGVKF